MHMCIFRETRTKTRNLVQLIFEGVPLYSKKKFKLMQAVQNAIVIDVKDDNDLFLCFLRFYDD